MVDKEKNDLTPEEQKLLDELGANRYEPGPGIDWNEGYATTPGYNPATRTPKNVNKDKLRNLLRIFGGDIFGPAFSQFVDVVAQFLSSGKSEGAPPILQTPVSMADFILVWEAETGQVFNELPANTQDAILQSYQMFNYEDEMIVELANDINNKAETLKNIYSKTGELPGEKFAHIDDAVIGAAITSDYAQEADLAYKAFLSKQQYDAELKTAAALALDNRTAQDFVDQLAAGTITKQEYLDGMDNIIAASGEFTTQEIASIYENPMQYINAGADMDSFLAAKFADPTMFGFIGIGTDEYQQELYSSKADGEKIPLYEIGMDTQLFANSSPEEIAEVQLLLVQAGFLQPYSFAYGVIDYNQPDGGTLAGITSAMSRFNLNGETITKADLYSILLAPGATSANLITFVIENFKDTLEDYAYGTGKFEPNSTVGYSKSYKNMFQYQSPNLVNARADVQSILESGLGRPVTAQEINAFVDYYNQVSYDVQKSNFDIRNRNLATQMLGEQQRYKGFVSGGDTGMALPTLESEIDEKKALASGLQNYVRTQYGEAITGEDKQKAMQQALIGFLNTLGTLGSYTPGG